ncbi:MAG: hypothetical protein R3F20_01035 [Planctomycetota bacterium]
MVLASTAPLSILIPLLALLSHGAPSSPAAIGLGEAAAAPQSGSVVDLRGRRLTRFEKSAGRSELGRPVRLELPASVITVPAFEALDGGRAWGTFVHRGVRYHFRRHDPHLAQTLRKLEKDPKARKGKIVWRGVVTRVRHGGETVVSVRLEEVKPRRK